MGYLLEYDLISVGFLLDLYWLVIPLHKKYSLKCSLISNRFLLDIYRLVIRILSHF